MKKLKIALVASEVAPFSKTGGLADVTGSLPKTFFNLGHEVIIFTPFYEKVINSKKFNLKLLKRKIALSIDSVKVNFFLLEGKLNSNISVYFIGNKKYFSKHHRLYGSKHENARFLFFDLAVIKTLKEINFVPDVIHCHDWHTGLIPYFLKTLFLDDPFFKKTATVFTIHNLTFQLGKNWWEILPQKQDSGTGKLPPFHSQDLENINFAKRGILYADALNTVSEKYAEELLTPELGQGLEKYLKRRQKDFFGIINGIDYSVFNPAIDKNVYINYDWDSLSRKKRNKTNLQKELGLEERADIPLISLVSRLAEQKGYTLVIECIDVLLRQNLQIVIIASANGGRDGKEYIDIFRKIAKKNSKKFAFITPYTEEMASKVYAGSDILLMPSRFEPCGLSPLIGLRYGTIPVVHETGGLAETITNFNPKTGHGNGFVFKSYTKEDFLMALTRALENYKYEKVWEHLVWKSMKQSFSWEIPAKKYIALFRKAIKNKLTFLKLET